MGVLTPYVRTRYWPDHWGQRFQASVIHARGQRGRQDVPEWAPAKGLKMRATSMRRLVGGAAALMLIGTTLLTAAGSALAADTRFIYVGPDARAVDKSVPSA